MKKILAISVLLNAAFVVGVSWKELTAHAAGGGVPIGNGDVNGDGKLDLTDAVYLLSGLFMGGPPPVPIEFPPPTGKGLPATGQTKCYDLAGNLIDCRSADYPGQEGANQAGCPGEGRFVENGDGTVTDNCTGLVWQKDTADVSGDGKIDDADRLNWQDALKYCNSLGNGWRLPNVRELQSIVDYGRLIPAIDPVFGASSVASNWYWSSSSYVSNPDYAWNVLFNGGFVGNGGETKATPMFVRAVRSGP